MAKQITTASGTVAGDIARLSDILEPFGVDWRPLRS